MTTLAAASSRSPSTVAAGRGAIASKAAGGTSAAAKGGTASAKAAKAEAAEAEQAKAEPAALIDLSATVRTQLARIVAPASTGPVSDIAGIKSFDEIVQDRTGKLAADLGARLKTLGIPLDDPITLQIDGIGTVTTDSPYKKKIEKMFEDDPGLAKAFKDVASLNSMRAAQKALEAFEAEKRAARNDDERDAAYGRYTARLMTSQDLSGTMTLDDGKLRSASVAFMARSVGEVTAAEPSERAKRVTAPRLSRTA